MKATRFFTLMLAVPLLLLQGASGQVCPPDGMDVPPFPVGTAFTYQGLLTFTTPGGQTSPVDDTCNFAFDLYDCKTGGSLIGKAKVLDVNDPSANLCEPPPAIPPPLYCDPDPAPTCSVTVIDGHFTVQLDFGNVYAGDARFLEITVDCPGAFGCKTLTPRQELTPVPYAIFASNAGAGGNFWSLTGNTGTDPDPNSNNNFLGTTDNVALELRVNGQRALRLEPSGDVSRPGSSNIVGGHRDNIVGPGIAGATISGGGALGDRANQVTASFATVGGGRDNTASDGHATVGGGFSNTASGSFSTVGGGAINDAIGDSSTVAGGAANYAGAWRATVGGGGANIASGIHATVGGGFVNEASGLSATVPGGRQNIAGGDWSFAAGRLAKVRSPEEVVAEEGGVDTDGDEGTFVWSDSTAVFPDFFKSTGPNQFLIRASGGVGINKNNPAPGTLDVEGNIHASGTLQSGSSITIDGTPGSERITSTGALDFYVPNINVPGPGNNRALRLEPSADPNFADAPNVIGGHGGNSAGPGLVAGATIAGGGHGTFANHAFNFSSVGGGSNNNASGYSATIGGGAGNTASGFEGATVGGGFFNTASGNKSTVGGGESNTASPHFSTVAGGVNNTASGGWSTVGGGLHNEANARYSTIAGGGPSDESNPTTTNNHVTDYYGTIAGGGNNQAGSDDGILTNGVYATVPGGQSNTAAGSYSFAAGRRANVGATHHGTFVWADSDDNSNMGLAFTSTGLDQFLIRAAGGVGINKNNPAAGTLDVQGDIKASGTITSGSSITIAGNATPNTISSDNADALELHVASGRALRLEPGNGPNLIGGSSANSVTSDAVGGTIAGGGNTGFPNRVTDNYGTVGGGQSNQAGDNAGTTADRPFATVGGGALNTASGVVSTVGGGNVNAATGLRSTVGGGLSNTASGVAATVPGGERNVAGGFSSFAAGQRAKVRDAAATGDGNGDEGTFVWSDSTTAFPNFFESTGPNQFLIRASGGVGIGTNDLQGNQLVVNGDVCIRGNLCLTGNITTPGTITGMLTDASAQCIDCFSDRRLKDHIKPITGGLDKVTRLRGVSFKWRRDEFPKMKFRDGQQIGLIAQEVADVLPEVVVTNADGYKGIQYGKVVAVLVEAIKEQQQIINSTRSELGDLKQRLAAVERAVGVEKKPQRANSAGLGGTLTAAALVLAALVGFVRHARTRKVGGR